MIARTDTSKTFISAIFIACVIAANVVAAKILQLGPFQITAGVMFYGFTFLCTDFMSELYGRKAANHLVFAGFTASVIVSLMFLLIQYLPSAPFAAEVQKSYVGLLGTNFRFVSASMLAYLVAQTWDVYLFHKIGKATKGKKKWLRNNVATMTSQLADTLIFTLIAFGISEHFLTLLVSQYFVKFLIALFDTPLFYLFTKSYVQEEFTAVDTSK